MNVQYISDSKGKTTGVFIPIKEWEYIKKKYKDLELDEFDIPPWHMEIVRERLKEHYSNPENALDFHSALDEIDREL